MNPFSISAWNLIYLIVLPLSGPRIIGVQPSYKIGDEVNLTCISARSKPYSTLKWYVVFNTLLFLILDIID
ncbi:hypothetical protein QR98_0002240 [Sarcoptes scabiei]|uniref:Ig-like domain-containing protein n=1 Tax=Sarcoptes scabiei TaxID=52283 RepID=A0A131ZT10_SARSC|nr:hypothetical protein QR98_0002240 [Sarcoptes scabiei]